MMGEIAVNSGMSHRFDADGVLRIVFDRPGERVNLLNGEILRELGALLDSARDRDDVRGLFFVSAKPDMFIGGMDVEEIGAIDDAVRGAEGARVGQAVFHKIADFGRPSVCAIGGPCMGGGTELALACTFRVAADGPKVRLALPEVRLGIIPGFGGSQRLPRLIGLPGALDLILTGRTLDARRARKIGLVDAVVPAAYLEREALALLRRASQDGVETVVREVRRKPPMTAVAMEKIGPLRRFVLEQARKKTASRIDPKDYPAPFRAIEAIEIAVTQPLLQGLDAEARIVGELIPTETARNLIWLFKGQAALKGDAPFLRATPRRVQRTAVIGAGIMGGGIAQLIADNGLPVRLKDLRYDAILTALKTAQGVWGAKLKRRRITRRELAQKMAFIAPTLDETGLARVDVVLEAVVEDLNVKRAVLAQLEPRLSERVVFASNTSSLPISEIARGSRRPERVVGLHFFNPVHRMPLVEVISGRLSSPEAVATVRALAIALGKIPVVVKDGPGFLVNRILTFYLMEAMRLLVEGVRIEAMDGAMKSFGMPMGPFALMDQVGLDTAGHVGEVLRAAFGRRIGTEESPLRAMVESGRLGKKNGRGFYRYRSGKATVPDPECYGLIGSPSPREIPPEMLQERLVLAMVNEAAICLEDGVAREPRDIDLAMVLGTGFPPFRGGLLRYADSVGIPIVTDRLSRMADAHGERFRAAEILQQMVREQRRFY